MDVWDWLRELRRWWWMVVLVPALAGAFAWFTAPAPQYQVTWSILITYGDPAFANNPTYFDFVLLDDMAQLIEAGALGDVLYTRLPADTQAKISREQFGGMVETARRSRFVELTVSAPDADTAQIVADTVNDNLESIANAYLVPPDYRNGPGTVTVMDPMTAPTLNTRDRLVRVAAIGGAAGLMGLAGSGVAEWLRLSRQAKYTAK